MPSEETNTHRVLFGQFGEAESKDFLEPLDDTECADDYGYHSDSDLEEDEDSVSPKEARKQTGFSRGDLSDIFCFLPVEDEPVCGEYEECLEKGKVIRIQDMAFITYFSFGLCHDTSDNLIDSRRFYSTFTPTQSSWRPTDGTIIAGLGVRRYSPCQRSQSLDHLQSLSIDLQIRSLPFLLCRRKF